MSAFSATSFSYTKSLDRADNEVFAGEATRCVARGRHAMRPIIATTALRLRL
jgi:hypothetical protein